MSRQESLLSKIIYTAAGETGSQNVEQIKVLTRKINEVKSVQSAAPVLFVCCCF